MNTTSQCLKKDGSVSSEIWKMEKNPKPSEAKPYWKTAFADINGVSQIADSSNNINSSQLSKKVQENLRKRVDEMKKRLEKANREFRKAMKSKFLW